MGRSLDQAGAAGGPGGGGLNSFVFSQGAVRVVFAPGALDRVRDEVDGLGVDRVVVVAGGSTKEAAERLGAALGERCTTSLVGAREHVPREDADAAVAAYRHAGGDGVVAVGGGSAIGLAKAVALETGAPVVAVPTTYSGSEMTPVYGITEGGKKRTGRDERVRPRSVVYDPLLTLSLPAHVSAASGMNALAHAVEALYAPDRSPVSALLGAEAFRTLRRALPRVVAEPAEAGARRDALLGAFLAGAALAITSMGLHHKLCHVLGGAFGLPHAPTHAVLLPHVTRFEEEAARPDLEPLGINVAESLLALLRSLPLPQTLPELGFDEDGVGKVAADVMESPPPGPRPVTAHDVEAIVRAACRA